MYSLCSQSLSFYFYFTPFKAVGRISDCAGILDTDIVDVAVIVRLAWYARYSTIS